MCKRFILTSFSERKLLIAPAVLQPTGCREVILLSPLSVIKLRMISAHGWSSQVLMPCTLSQPKDILCG
ncbi:hypothetical protein [Ruminococcus albus]|uniref:hypothetical protein n=1 Tax=Ruminococcus albus TaxID=1264 RepID=UPI000AD3A0B5|nr:hypothetical protein [Ruminococcus albus]